MTASFFVIELIDPARLRADATAGDVTKLARMVLEAEGFRIRVCDDRKPWGAEIKLRGSPDRAQSFLQYFFGDLEIAATLKDPVTPKILLIKQAGRTSWHFHERTDSFLRILHGNVGVSLSATDEEAVPRVHGPGDDLHVPSLMRQRLSSLSGWAVVAKIGRDVVPGHPGGDDDVRRVSDEHGR